MENKEQEEVSSNMKNLLEENNAPETLSHQNQTQKENENNKISLMNYACYPRKPFSISLDPKDVSLDSTILNLRNYISKLLNYS